VSVAHGLKFDATGILNCEKLNNFACLKVWGAVCNNIISDRFSTKTASLAEIAISTTDNISACRELSLPEIAVFVLNLSDIIFLQTAPHMKA